MLVLATMRGYPRRSDDAPLVLIIDDHDGSRRRRGRCGSDAEAQGIAMVRDATAVGAVARVRPEVVLLDAQLPVVDGFAVLASGRRRWPRLGSTLADNCVPTTPERNSTTRECTSPQGRTAAGGRRWVGASCRPGGFGPVTCTRLSRASARGGGFTTAAGSCR